MPEPSTTPEIDVDLDHLYWRTDLPVADVAARSGRPTRGLHQHVTPQPAGITCYRCGRELSFTSRSQRDGQRLRCSSCGCSRRNPDHHDRRRPARPAVTLVGRSIIVVRESWRDAGFAIEACIDVLADAGEAWDGRSLVVIPDGERRPDAVIRALASFDPGVVAVESLADLAITQTERLQVLFTLTRARWRVLAACDLRIDTAVTARHLDELDELDAEPHDGLRPWGRPTPLSQRLINATASSTLRTRHSW